MNAAEEFSRILIDSFTPHGVLSREQVSLLYEHWSLLTRWNRALNLTTVTSLEESVLRHYCESLFVGLHVPVEPVSVLDVGSGAGFPGIPMAILRPDCTFTLAESHQRKAVFLREATRQRPNVRVVPRRAEELRPEAFEWVVSRAVRWRDVAKLATKSIALLLGQEDAEEFLRQPGFRFQPPFQLPWGDRRFAVIGHRS
jgi:16S rRNA (guanine527-N7)-methyltransferase